MGITRKLPSGAPAVIKLDCDEPNARVKVIPPDRDVMVVTVRAAIEACRAYDEQIRFNDQFEQLLPTLGAWLSERKDKVEKAYLTVAETGLIFLVVLKGTHYDKTIEDDLTEFDVQIANEPDFSLMRIGVLAIPNLSEDALHAFLDPDNAVTYSHAK